MPTSPAAPIARLTARLRAGIYSGKYAAGSQLPTRRKLGARYGISEQSAGVALQALSSEGLVSLEVGRGSFVMPLHEWSVQVRVPYADDRPDAFDRARSVVARRMRGEPAVTDPAQAQAQARWPVLEPGAEFAVDVKVKAPDAGHAGALVCRLVTEALSDAGGRVSPQQVCLAVAPA